MKNPRIDITHIPFSRYGAYISLTRNEGKNGEKAPNELIIHSVRRRFEEGPTYSLSFGNTEAEDFTCIADPAVLTVNNDNGYARIYIRDDDTLVIDSFGLNIFLKQLQWGYGTETGERSFRLYPECRSLITTIALQLGKGVLDGPYSGPYTGSNRKTDMTVSCEDGRSLMAICIKSKEPKEIPLPITPEQDITAIRSEWEAFLSQMPDEPETDPETYEFVCTTWYNLWSCFVRAEGCYINDTMLMSKKFMSSTWSWDHCFNALAMANLKDKKLAKIFALNQFLAPFALQTEMGVLPDMWNPDVETRWGTTKPPVHGWCFSLLMDRFEFTAEELKEIYICLKKWTEWWMNHSDTDHDGIPDYPQGCDSGWDNSTLFDIGYFLESPDLPSFLILQMRTLKRIAGKLGNTKNEEYWRSESEKLIERLIEHSWNGKRFIAKLSRSHEYEKSPTSLLSLMPLVLGDLLSSGINNKLTIILERDFLTENGLATEMPSSEKYDPDGYWRGPIWAPTTYLIVDGLRRCGNNRLAETIAERYCRMSCQKAKGNYENFDALTGLGRRAPGYTWAASVYMLLHWEYGY
ncbi:MAG: amylo-alpha-1,6-glucosidase [Eubacteriales bacterium]|jgi:putative isomerase